MTAIAEFWVSLGAAGQAALVGLLTSIVVAVVQRLWPGLALMPNRVKRLLIAVGAGLSAYAATASWGAAIAAALSAFGSYQLARAWVRNE